MSEMEDSIVFSQEEIARSLIDTVKKRFNAEDAGGKISVVAFESPNGRICIELRGLKAAFTVRKRGTR